MNPARRVLALLSAAACAATPMAAQAPDPEPRRTTPTEQTVAREPLPDRVAPASREGSPALDAALDAARWLESVAVPAPHGLVWEPDPRQPALPHLDLSLYHGVSGVALFFAALFENTGDTSHRRLATGAGSTLLGQLDDESLEAGLYTGTAGIGASLLELWRATGDARFRDGAAAVVERLRRTARTAGAGVDWNESTDIVSGSAGIGLFLLAAGDRLGSVPARELAAAAGRRLVELGRTAPGGLRWAMTPDFPRTMPNFSHGTAGVAYFLATLHRDTVSPPADGGAFLDAALAGARHLTTIAERGESGELCLIYHHEPGGEDLHYLSWCHGPAGTARLFHRLHEITGDPEWRSWVERSARAVLESGIPEARTSGYWNNVSQCCGAAGVLDFSLSLYRATGEERFLDFARRVGVDIVHRGTTDAGGLAWVQAEHRLQPELLVAQTGYMQGAAGVGMALLRLHLVEQGRDVAVRLPDDPW